MPEPHIGGAFLYFPVGPLLDPGERLLIDWKGTKMLMRTRAELLRLFLLLAVCVISAAGAQIQVDEPPEPGCCRPGTFFVYSTSFTFLGGLGDIQPCYVGTTEVPECLFYNNSGVDWNNLEVRITPGTELVGCAAKFGFDACTPRQGTAELASVITFSGGRGIRTGDILSFSGLGWTSQATFNIVANPVSDTNPVPEARSVALVLSGMAAVLVSRRRRWLRRRLRLTGK